MALRYHPDKNPDDQKALERFRLCTEAYNYLIENFSLNQVSLQELNQDVSVKIEDLNDIFDDIFGFTREDRILGIQEPQSIELTLQELAFGVTKTLKLYAFEKCISCQGNGSLQETHPIICTYCFGKGQIKANVGQKQQHQPCPRCFGRGRLVRQPCPDCDGFGRIRKFYKQTIKIPQGLCPNASYTIQSTVVGSAKVCDLFILPQLLPHPFFRVEGYDVLCDYPFPKKNLSQENKWSIPTLWGWSEFKIPSQVVNGEIVSLKGYGLYTSPLKQKRGDFNIRLGFTSERKFKKESQLFLQEMSLKNPYYPQVPLSFWSKLKRAFL